MYLSGSLGSISKWELNLDAYIQIWYFTDIVPLVARWSRWLRQNGAGRGVKNKSWDFAENFSFPIWIGCWSMQLSLLFSASLPWLWLRGAPLFCGFLASATLDYVHFPSIPPFRKILSKRSSKHKTSRKKILVITIGLETEIGSSISERGISTFGSQTGVEISVLTGL